MFSSMRTARALLALSAVALSGCTSLLGDFTYDPNGSGGSNGNPDVKQGDIVVMPTTTLVTNEQGAKATFTIMLKRAPTATVAIALNSSNTAEGMVSPSVLSFTADNFGAPQMAQVTGVNDDAEDGPQAYTILTSPATSEDKTYHSINPIDPPVTNVDDDTAGFTLMPPSGLVTTESGGQAVFTIALNHAPTADVQVPLSSDNLAEGIVSPAMLIFTADNWMAPQMVTVTGVDDTAKDHAQKFHVVTAAVTSADAKYNGLNPSDQEVTNNDNDTAGVILNPPNNLLTSEKLEMTSLTIALSSPPTGNVVMGLTSSDASEGTVMPASVTFTPDNWMAPQVISVTGVNDDRVDGSQPYQVVTSIISSDDPDYATLEPPNADVTNIDDDTPGLRLTPIGDPTTSEDLGSATFTVVLNSRPVADVLLDVASSRATEGVASPPSLHFTEMNWDAPQTVTVMGVNDDVADKNQAYVVHVKPNAGTQDPDYALLLEQDIALTNIDNDSAGVVVEPRLGLMTREDGTTASFTVKLTSQPTADVTIALASSNTAEGTLDLGSLTFTPENFRSAQLVTVRGADDKVQDGGQPYRINTDNAVSNDTNYQGMEVPNVEVLNVDNDTAGITVKPGNNVTLVTREDGSTATFTVELNSQPTADVSFGLTSNDLGEGTVNPANLKFTAANWNAPQTVTLKGVDEMMHDGTQQYRIIFGAISSGDALYGALARPLDVKAENTDNDSAGITLRNFTDLRTTEKDAGTATFQVRLDSEPSGNVEIGVTSSRPGEGTVNPPKLTFTNINWAAPQNVTITGVNDSVQDGNQSFFINFTGSTSTDTDYQGLVPKPANVTVSNVDDDTAGIVVASPSTGLITTEAGGTSTFTVKLQSQPTQDVVVPLKSNKTTEGTVSPASLTFTSANWNGARTVTLTGVDDDAVDGDQKFIVSVGPATSADPQYVGKSWSDLTASNHDRDTAKILVAPLTPATTTEKGGTAQFTLALQTRPSADVSIVVASTDLTEGSVLPASVTFTPVDWASPKKITVTGVDDKMQDSDQTFIVDVKAATSTDINYQALDAPDVTLSNLDDDTAKITVTQITNKTNESGDTATFSIVLDTQPSAAVALAFASSNTKEGTLSDSSVSFSTADWNSPRTITVTGVDDDSTADGEQQYSVVFEAATGTDKNYAGKKPTPLVFLNGDNDSAGIGVSTVTGKTSESGGAFSFTIWLKSKPKGEVTIPISSNDKGEGIVDKASLTFTTSDWASKKSVTVTGVDDNDIDGSPNYGVVLGAPTSTDQAYADIDPPDVLVTNTDNDTADIIVGPKSGDGTTSEGGGTTTFNVKLASKPKADVTVTLTSSDPTEGSVTPAKVVLTSANWELGLPVVVHGENDDEQDDRQPYTILTGTSSSTDLDYNGLAVDDVRVENIDDDTAGYTVTAASANTSEAGGPATFWVSLNTKPSGAVSIPLSSSNTAEGILAAAVSSVDFTTTNWKTAQPIVVNGVDDNDVDGDIGYKILLGKPTTTDTNYAAKKPPDVSLINDDNDAAGFNIIELPMVNMTSEASPLTTITFKVVLTSKPKSPVTIPLKSSDETEGIITTPSLGAALVFDATNWSTGQPVTIRGVDDAIFDMDQSYSIVIGAPQSADTKYSVLGPKMVNLVNVDNDPL